MTETNKLKTSLHSDAEACSVMHHFQAVMSNQVDGYIFLLENVTKLNKLYEQLIQYDK